MQKTSALASKNSVSDSSEGDDLGMNSSCDSVSDNDSDDSETIIMLKTPLKKPEVLASSLSLQSKEEIKSNVDKVEDQGKATSSITSAKRTKMQQIISELNLQETAD